MNNIEKLGFDYWFKDKVDLSKTADLQIARVMIVNKNTQRLGPRNIYNIFILCENIFLFTEIKYEGNILC
jgi:hypothetical protein